MPKPNVFVSHRWQYGDDYYNLISKLNQYGLPHLNYSVPEHNPLDANRINQIKSALREQVRQCNYFLVFANMAIGNSNWCKFEVDVASEYGKPILSVRPHGYNGNIPLFIQEADTEGGPIGFNTPSIIRRICTRLNWPLPMGL